MGTPTHMNWLGGSWLPSAAGHTFQDAARERWPRSGVGDLAQALAALHAAPAAGWAAWARAERHALLVAAAARLRADTQLPSQLGRVFGLDPDEAHWLADLDLFQLEQALEILREGGGAEGGGCGLFRAHWSDCAGRLGARVATHLVRGERVLLVADAHVPHAAAAWVRALVAAGLPDDALAFVSDDTGQLVDAALGRAELEWARLAGDEGELALRAQRARPGLLTSLWPLQDQSACVLAEADLDEAVAHAVEQGFGRWSTLSGQLPRRIGRVVCHERRFSRFTELLLEVLAASEAALRPLPLIEGRALAWLRETWDLGLDEGATPIFGEPPGEERAAPPPPEAPGDEVPFGAGVPGGYLVERPGSRAHPLVFTNVDPTSRLARLRRPEPCLRLIRAESDAAARRLAAELDRG